MVNLKAIYENGILRPLEPIALRENQEVTLFIQDADDDEIQDTKDDENLLDTEFLKSCRIDADTTVSLQAVRDALSKITGSLSDDIRAERDER